MNQLILVLKDKEHSDPVELWRSERTDDQENNELFETITAQFESDKVEPIKKAEPLITLRLEPIESTELSSYVRDFSVDAKKKDQLLSYLKKSTAE